MENLKKNAVSVGIGVVLIVVATVLFIIAAQQKWAAPATIWAGAGSVAALVTAVMAVWTLVALRQDSRDRTRPMMLAELKSSVLTTGNSELHVTNAGPSVAKNVRVTFDPPLPVLDEQANPQSVTPYLQRRYWPVPNE